MREEELHDQRSMWRSGSMIETGQGLFWYVICICIFEFTFFKAVQPLILILRIYELMSWQVSLVSFYFIFMLNRLENNEYCCVFPQVATTSVTYISCVYMIINQETRSAERKDGHGFGTHKLDFSRVSRFSWLTFWYLFELLNTCATNFLSRILWLAENK